MKKKLATILACLSLSTVGIEALGSLEQTTLELQKVGQSKESTVEKHCKHGPRGHRGDRGKRGKKGERGHQGPAGEAVEDEFGEAYLILGDELVSVPTGTPAPVQFNTLGPISSHITYDAATWTFTIQTAGTYTIEYGATACTRAEDTTVPIDLMTLNVLINGIPAGVTNVPGMALVEIPEVVSSPFTSFVDPSNQITRTLAVGTTITLVSLATPLSTEVGFLPIYGIAVPSQEVAYISIEKIG